MKFQLKKISVKWKMESVSDPFFKFSDDGLEVTFMIFLGDEERINDIANYMRENKICKEIKIPDDVYNNSGYAMIYFNFSGFNELYCTSRDDYLKSLDNTADITLGYYEKIDADGKVCGYVFIGHDISLAIDAKKSPSEYISKLVQV